MSDIALLAIPPRFMWGWGPGVSGYCGSMTIQSIALYYGSYLSQDRVRGTTGGHDGKHEIMLGHGGCCAAIDAMAKLQLNASQWPYWSAPQPQHAAFLQWMEKAVRAREPVAFGLFMQTESSPKFDHIVPLVGFSTGSRGRELVFNDLHSNVSLRRSLDAFVANRSACHRALPWAQRFAYCLPSDVNYGIRVHGNADPRGELKPARLLMDEWSEPDYSTEDGKGAAPQPLHATLVASELAPRAEYALLRYTDMERVPHSDFLSNSTGGIVSRVDFVAGADGAYRQRVSFWSNETVFYRVVAR